MQSARPRNPIRLAKSLLPKRPTSDTFAGARVAGRIARLSGTYMWIDATKIRLLAINHALSAAVENDLLPEWTP